MTYCNNKTQKCSSCSRIIRDKQKFIERLTCGRWFHAVPSCVKSFDTNVITEKTTNFCQDCLDDSLPFQKLDDLDYEFTVLKGNNVCERDMDRLRHFKFSPFDAHSNIALTSNNENLSYSSLMILIN